MSHLALDACYRAVCGAGLLWFSSQLHAAIPPAEHASQLAHHFLTRTAMHTVPMLASIEAAHDVQTLYLQRLETTLGPVVGYKAGLTNAAAQARFGATQPVAGVLLARMLHESPAHLPADFAARPLAEADLLVRVGDAAINTARDATQVLAALDAVIPFLELPDLLYAPGLNIDAIALIANNVGARAGVCGAPIALTAGQDWMRRLADFEVIILNAAGDELGRGRGADLLGHPLRSVLWLRDDLRARGISLRPGDLLSLGTLTPLHPISAGERLELRYRGLDPAGVVSVRASFALERTP